MLLEFVLIIRYETFRPHQKSAATGVTNDSGDPETTRRYL